MWTDFTTRTREPTQKRKYSLRYRTSTLQSRTWPAPAEAAWERLLLIGLIGFILVVELLNTAIEKLADRVSRDIDPQIGRLKDMGSAAVGLSLLIAGATWLLALAKRLGLF